MKSSQKNKYQEAKKDVEAYQALLNSFKQKTKLR